MVVGGLDRVEAVVAHELVPVEPRFGEGVLCHFVIQVVVDGLLVGLDERFVVLHLEVFAVVAVVVIARVFE